MVGEGFDPEKDAAVREVIAAFERETGKQVDLEQPSQSDIAAKALAAVADGQPPDFLLGTNMDYFFGQWAENRAAFIDLSV